MEVCGLSAEQVCELSLSELSELNIEKLPLQVLYALEDHAKDKGYSDVLKSVDTEIRQRSLPRLAKITAGWIVLAALHHNIVSGATCDPQVDWAFEAHPELDVPIWSPLLELVKFAFYEETDEMYDDIGVADSAGDMSYDVLYQMLQNPDLVKEFESGGEPATPGTIESACNTILKVLWTDDGRFLEDIAQCLIDEQSISSEKVRGLMACRNIDLKR